MAGRLMLAPLYWNQAAFVGSVPAIARIQHQRHYVDVIDGGLGSVLGVAPGLVTYDGVPGRALVHLCEYPTMRIIRSTRSAPNGTYALTGVRTGRDYVVVAFDETRNDNAVIVDRVRAGP